MVTPTGEGGQGGRGRGPTLVAILCLALLCLVAFGCASPARAAQDTPAAVARCKELVPGFDEHPGPIASEVQGSPDTILGVRLTWPRGDGDHAQDWIICWFLPLTETEGLWQIDQVRTKNHGVMLRYDVQQLYKMLWLRTHDNVLPSEPKVAQTPLAHALYLLQQTINGITIGCLYALLAVSFNLIYGIARFINLAFGELYMVGAFATYLAYVVTLNLGAGFTLLPIAATALYVIVVGALAGWSTNFLVFSRLRQSASTVPLIASIALAILISNTVLVLQGPKTRWMPQYQHSAWRITEGLGYDIYLRKGHVFIGIGTACIAALLWWVSQRSDLGRSYRACAQDPKMAALLGVDVRGTIGLSFAFSGALTGAAGLFEALQYNAVDFHMGFIVAIKALTAALLGGIGSVPGALAGGFILAGIETYAGTLIGFEWRDIVVFGVLALVLVFRPGGLFGTLRLMPADERP
jgi:branched-chain amino acid transport system permease protein